VLGATPVARGAWRVGLLTRATVGPSDQIRNGVHRINPALQTMNRETWLMIPSLFSPTKPPDFC
jgi:hypothetical protein